MLLVQHTQSPSWRREAGLVVCGVLVGLLLAASSERLRSQQPAAPPGGRAAATSLSDSALLPLVLPWLAPDRAGGEAYEAQEAPSKEAFERLQAHPELLAKDPRLADEFVAAPWLLPPRSAALPYAGVHDFDALLAIQGRPAGRYPKAVALLLFSKDYAVMSQNSIYSLVKHGGVRNFIAMALREPDLEACKDLNLPCADARDLLLEPLSSAGQPSQRDFHLMMWIKPAVVLRALRQGYAVMTADTDIAYSVKPLWDSYLAFIAAAGADGAWQEEKPFNSGHFVLVPTPAALAFAEAWAASAPANLDARVSEQKGLPQLAGQAFLNCSSLCQCHRGGYNLTRQGRRASMAVFRTYLPSHFVYTQHWCTIGSPHWMPRIDPCDWAGKGTLLYLHPICVSGSAAKEAVRRAAGFWFMDSETGCPPQRGAASGTPACRPLHWKQAQAEEGHYACRTFELGLAHGGEPAALAALRAGPDNAAAAELLHLDRTSLC